VLLSLGIAAASSSACSSEPPRAEAAIVMHFSDPKALIDVDGVTLRVYPSSAIACKGAVLDPAATVPDTATYELALQRCPDGVRWCGTLEKVPIDEATELTWYVDGRATAAANPTFTGCTQTAVKQSPQEIDLKIEKWIPGSVCGDGTIIPPETCEGAADDSCDGACHTKEQILSNGLVTDPNWGGYQRGNAGDKRALMSGFLADGRYIATWSDFVGGVDGEITVRRLSSTLQTDTSTVLQHEFRLQILGNNIYSGSKIRRGPSDAPSWALVESQNPLFVFQRQEPGSPIAVWASLQTKNLAASVADVQISGSAAATKPRVAAASNGDALIVWLEGAALKSVLRKSGGTLSAAKTIAASGVATAPRLAWVGGDYVVVWGDGDDIKMQRVAADGSLKGTSAVVNAARTVGKQSDPDIAAFATGEFLVAFRDDAGDVGADIRVQKFDKLGAATGSEIGAVVNDTVKNGDQATPAVAAGTNSKGARFYAVAWVDPSTPQIQARIVNADGDGYLANSVTGYTSEFSVGLAPGLRSAPSVAVGGQAPGYLVIGWVDESPGTAAADDDRVRVRRLPLPADFD
jgi:hypothetical protein